MTIQEQSYALALQLAALNAPAEAIQTEADLNAAIDAAIPNATLTLDPTLVYNAPFILTKPLTLVASNYQADDGQIPWDFPAPLFAGGIDAQADDYRFLGIAAMSQSAIGNGGDAIVTWHGSGGYWSRCRVLGHPSLGAHHGMLWIGGDTTIEDCYIDNVKGWGYDTQAIVGWNCLPGLTVRRSFLRAAGQSFMAGGSDSAGPESVPHGLLMEDCQLWLNPDWIGQGYQCKPRLEFKSMIDATVRRCDMVGAGTSDGQGGYLCDFTVRNQDGAASWSNVQNIDIGFCTGSHASGIANILGTDNVNASGVMDTLNIHDFTCTEMDGIGSNRFFIIGGGPRHVTLKNITSDGVGKAARIYFYGVPPPVGMVLAGIHLPVTTYDYILDGDTGHGGQGPVKILEYAPDAALDTTVKQG